MTNDTHTFEMALFAKENSASVVQCASLPEAACTTELLMAICERLSELDIVEFHVSGFGRNPWPTDVYTDLSVIMEQIPEAIRQIECEEKCAINFYEQGIEASISMSPEGSSVTLECSSQTDWTPNPAKLSMQKSELLKMLRSLKKDFSDLAATCFPIAENRFFKKWLLE